MYGDVNLDGRIELTDSIVLNKYIAAAMQLSEPALRNADVDGVAGVDTNDSITLLRFLVHAIASLPYTE